MLRYIFEHITRCTSIESIIHIFEIFIHSYENDACCRALLLNVPACSQTILLWHTHIKQGKIRFHATAEEQSLVTICRLADDFQSVLTSEHSTETSPSKLMVISDDQTRRLRLLPA